MKKHEMDKLRKFIKSSTEDGWRHVPMGLAQLLDTFEVEEESVTVYRICETCKTLDHKPATCPNESCGGFYKRTEGKE